MRIITTHINADFDGMASMIAAQKLYPDGLLVFPGSQEKTLREFISHTLLYQYDFIKAKQVELANVTSLVIVDTRSSSRLGPLAECLNNPGVSVHLYDHHPKSGGDLVGDLEVVRDVGSTMTLFAEILQEKKIKISEEEATIFSLGIYEDTGSLTYASTGASKIMVPMAVSMIWGLAFATVLTLFLIPALVAIVDDIQGRKRRLLARLDRGKTAK